MVGSHWLLCVPSGWEGSLRENESSDNDKHSLADSHDPLEAHKQPDLILDIPRDIVTVDVTMLAFPQTPHHFES